jgi:hypothetical protein
MKPLAARSIALGHSRPTAKRPYGPHLLVLAIAWFVFVGPQSMAAWAQPAPTSAQALAQQVTVSQPIWLVREGEGRFALRAPDGFLRQNTDGAAIAAFLHPGRHAVLLVLEFPWQLVQGQPLDPAQIRELRQADMFESDDRVTTFRVLGFETPGLVGRGAIDGQRVVRFIATVPLRTSTPVVLLLGLERDEAALRQTFLQTLESVRGDTHFTTPAQRTLDAIARWSLILALVTGVSYALARRWRWSDRDQAPPTRIRIALRAVFSLAVAAHAIWWLRWSSWMLRGMGVLLALFAVQQAIATAGLVRARSQLATSDSHSQALAARDE